MKETKQKTAAEVDAEWQETIERADKLWWCGRLDLVRRIIKLEKTNDMWMQLAVYGWFALMLLGVIFYSIHYAH